MRRYILSFINSLFFLPAIAQPVPQSIYDFKVDGLTGGTIDFAQFRGKKILIVNTASHCTYTPQYGQLEALYKKYQDKLVIVGFPCNNFFFEERGNNKEIEEFCKKNYGVSFPMASKISVKGRKQAPIYTWLTNERYNHFKSVSVKWNFQKYLIDEKGQLVAVFYPNTRPGAPEVIRAIEAK
jgi:glutathione peroxidase